MIKSICLLFLFVYNTNSLTYNEDTFFNNSAPLNYAEGNGASDQNLYWNFTSEDITFKLVMKTTGWVGFGLSPNGGMKNSDIIQAWKNTDGTVMFKDAHIENSYSVIYDTVQNWKRLFYSQSNGVTTVIFTRKLKICSPNLSSEININVEPTSYVIYAWGTNFNNGFPTMHASTNRGSKSLPLLAALNQKIVLNMKEIESYEYKINVSTNLKNKFQLEVISYK